MRGLTLTSLILLLTSCDADGAASAGSPTLDAGASSEAPSAPTADVDGDGGANVPDPSLPDGQREDAKSRPDPNAPPALRDGKKLYTVRFDSRAGEKPFACGKTAPLGTKGTLAEPVDVRFYVHDLSLIRASGERVPLELYQDERYQRENVALLDFSDDTGACLTGDADIRNLVNGYAPEQSDYTGLAFKMGVPPEKNHLNGAEAPAPYNASGLWWSWSGGYKYARIDVTSEAQPIWYFHAGATDCAGTIAEGFRCASTQIAKIELANYDPQTSLVVFDAARFYAASDLTVADDTPGCMGFKPDLQCAPLYNALGVVPWDDAAIGPAQTAFVLKTGAALVGNKGSTAATRKVTDPTAWPDPAYQRGAELDVENVSRAGETRSHSPSDPRHGSNCMRCHQENGPGIGKFTAAGTLLDALGEPASIGKIELFSADSSGYATFANVVSKAILDVDAHGNFFTTADLGLAKAELSARILGSEGKPLATMPFTQQTAACNNCHTGGMRLTLPAP